MRKITETRISAIDYYLPSEIVKTSHMMEEVAPERFGFATTLVENLIGITEVRHATDQEKPSVLAAKAAVKALSAFDGNPDDIGMIIFCGIDRDYIEPSTAHLVQNMLNLQQAVCFDLTNACIGFMNGIQMANAAILSGTVKHVLVCTGERSSSVSKSTVPLLINTDDKEYFFNRIGALTVGDAGAAAIISPAVDSSGFKGFNFSSNGKLAELCYYLRADSGELEGQMLMKEISNAIMASHVELLPSTLKSLNKTSNDIDCLITHQVGKRPWERYPKAMNVPISAMTKTFHKLGNITSATFAVNYAQALENQKIKKGDFVMAAMAGSGLSICQVAIEV